MIRLDTGTPGAGKTLINVDGIITLEKTNKKNILLNTKIYTSNRQIINDKNLQGEFEYLIRKEGQGVDLKDVVFHFDPFYFELFEKTERPEDYFFKSIYYNEIIQRINKEYDLTLNLLKPVRTIYTNIVGLEVDNVRPIPSDADWRKLPDGSYVVYDEIQNIPIFSSETKTIDPILKDLTIHRHRGFDIIGITQFPDLVHKNFRALVGHHRHLVNTFGLKRSTLYEWSTVKIDPNAFKNKATAEVKTTYSFPNTLYKLYRSSTAHTHKRRLPWRFILLLGMVIILLLSMVTCSLSKENNLVTRIATGDSNEKQQTESATDRTNPPVTSSSENPASEPLQSENEVLQETVSNTNSDLPVYDVSDPFDYSPDYRPEPVNYRVFSGCFCSNGVCTAYDQQGTAIRNINLKVCKGLMKDSANRPFDYFTAKQATNNAPVRTETDNSSYNQPDIQEPARLEQAKAEGLI